MSAVDCLLELVSLHKGILLSPYLDALSAIAVTVYLHKPQQDKSYRFTFSVNRVILIQGDSLVTRFPDSLPLLSVELKRKGRYRRYCGRHYKY